MASHYELELTLTSAKQLKNVNWRHGTNKPYAVVYIDPIIKFTTNIDQNEFKSRECSSTSRLPQQRYNAGGYTASYGEVRGKRKSEFGEMGIGFAVGAVAGILGELAFEKGVEYIEDRIVDEVVERVEDDLGSSDDDVAENVEDDGDDDDDDDDNVAENVEDDVGYDDDMGEIVDDDFGYDDDDDGYDGDDF
ncbi:hypothetical protein TSUD_289590 [Trifolium subterraneum]|uniref:Uncharacterized protein n=1 Tax=Trifolium subterraneum TaxID=3900 RepID=A0A2Z6M1E3_TRISU|nr:hypothetical protein TSUD_289590 [Trifolium subterraneum]